MNRKNIDFIDPVSGNTLLMINGYLVDRTSGSQYPVINSIPRFCDSSNYADSFGFQWNKFASVQIDEISGTKQSESRFYCQTGWVPEELKNLAILEVGSGAGRFSNVFLRTTSANLCSVDYSNAVEENLQNNIKYKPRLQLAQASIYALPFSDQTFDKIFCFGVLQHTPSFEGSIRSLVRKAKVGAEIVVDFYPIKGWYTKIHSKYMLRPLTRRMHKEVLLSLIRKNINWMIFLFKLLVDLRCGALTRFIPITDLRGLPSNLDHDQFAEWAIMDTFDGLSPRYDNPQKITNVIKIFEASNCVVTFSGRVLYDGGASTVVRAVRRG
jgi:SAM-dependent methyltransferase